MSYRMLCKQKWLHILSLPPCLCPSIPSSPSFLVPSLLPPPPSSSFVPPFSSLPSPSPSLLPPLGYSSSDQRCLQDTRGDSSLCKKTTWTTPTKIFWRKSIYLHKSTNYVKWLSVVISYSEIWRWGDYLKMFTRNKESKFSPLWGNSEKRYREKLQVLCEQEPWNEDTWTHFPVPNTMFVYSTIPNTCFQWEINCLRAEFKPTNSLWLSFSYQILLSPPQLTPMEMDFLSAHTTQVLSAFQEVCIRPIVLPY